MKKIILGIVTLLVFVGCSSKEVNENIVPKLVVGKSLDGVTLNDQFEKVHKIDGETKTVIFAFSKDSAHTCNDYFVTKPVNYLSDNKTQFIADVSSAPSLIRSMFIMPGLKDFKHTVLILDDKTVASEFRADMDTQKIVVVLVENHKVQTIKTITTQDELIAVIEKR
ncbi:MAG: hypothetical protein U9P38_05535 [Campylobacterota bacterium]|nr:hypothetical protein [Campylobacterota bacterium]